jgi:PAS domain S-box-containing protein
VTGGSQEPCASRLPGGDSTQAQSEGDEVKDDKRDSLAREPNAQRIGLTTRVLAAGLVIAVLLGVTFVSFRASIGQSRAATAKAESARVLTDLANQVQTLTLDLETGERGFIVTGKPVFLAPWQSARAVYPATLERLRQLHLDRGQQAAAADVSALAASYLRDWSNPIIAEASRRLPAARALVATGEGKRRVDAIRAAVSRLSASGVQASTAAQRQARSAQSRALVIGVIGVACAIALLAGLVIYVARAISRPVRRLSHAADELARGDMSQRVDVAGSREVATLGLAFNAMADAIQANRVERDARDRALRESEERLRAIVDNSSALIYVKDLEGRYVMANRQFRDLIARGDPIGSHVTDVHPPELAEAVMAHDAAVFERDEAIQFEERMAQDGGEHVYLTTKFPLRDAGGRTYALCAIATDMTARLTAEAEMRASHAFLDAVLEHIPHMIFVKDAVELRFVRLNHAGELLLGYSKDELIGRSDFDLFPGEAASFVSKDREVLATRRVLDIPEEPIQVAGGDVRYLHTKKLTIFDEHDQAQYLVGISEDITDRKLAQEALDAARDEAVQANLAKSEFLSRMSHELRTPLNAILGFAQLLEMDDLREAQREQVGYIVKAGRHLLSLINEVLDVSRIDAGSMTISPEPVNVDELVSGAVAMVRPLADENRVTINASFETRDVYVEADQQRLNQVLLNLLSNAIKYNRDRGTVSVAIDVDAHGPDARVRIVVSDTGGGIPEERLGEVFAPFERLGAEAGPIEGTGLGLALSKGLVELMGGALTVWSEAGLGSTFTVELARVREKTPVPAGEAQAVSDGLSRSTARILYVEDNLSNLKLVERIVSSRLSVVLQSAMQGSVGIDLARQQRPDLILLDLHLPDLSGEEVLRRLKADPRTASIPVIVLTADASRGQAERLKRIGAHHYVTKPLEITAFLASIEDALAGAHG